MNIFRIVLAFAATLPLYLSSANQTPTVDIPMSGNSLPFRIVIEPAGFTLPAGIQAFIWGFHDGKWLLLAGRTDGMHGFPPSPPLPPPFPPNEQNLFVFVVDPQAQTVAVKTLNDPTSGLSQKLIDELSVTAPQFYQLGKTLYMCGGYGLDTLSGRFTTKDSFIAIDIPGMMRWVNDVNFKESAIKYLRQIFHPIFRVTGGAMEQVNPRLPTLLMLGQDFEGDYAVVPEGIYTDQIRTFQIIDNGRDLFVRFIASTPRDPNLHRRDLNIVPIIKKNCDCCYEEAFLALSGVFTPSTGIWTVPVEITSEGVPFMADPANPNTFKQGMNNYFGATVSLYSKKTDDMFIVSFGGISFGYFQAGVFIEDPSFPFINQVTTIQIDENGNYQQYLMPDEFPVVLSAGIPLLFGAETEFIPAPNTPLFGNSVFQLDKLTRPTLLGYIVGGIQSLVPNPGGTPGLSAASPYIFKVTIIPK